MDIYYLGEFTHNIGVKHLFCYLLKTFYLVLSGTLAKYTGGQVYYYPSFHASTHGEKLQYELARNLTRETAWEAVMRIRCGKGLTIYLIILLFHFYLLKVSFAIRS